jgi:glucosamine-6-phosphate deaminase
MYTARVWRGFVRQLRYGELTVRVADTNASLGEAAADDFAATVRATLREQDEMSVILATGNSQLSFIAALSRRTDIPWPRISVLHMDEYEGMADTHPASFRRWMHEKLLTFADVKEFHGMRGDHVPVEEEIARYTQLLADLRPEICVMGIGENGHLAFNDPPARFDTEESVHLVRLDAQCRAQQVGEGHFPSLADTPTSALSLTVPALLRPAKVLVLTPERRKAAAVRAALEGPVTEDCPASILTTAGHATLYLDAESAGELSDASGAQTA